MAARPVSRCRARPAATEDSPNQSRAAPTWPSSSLRCAISRPRSRGLYWIEAIASAVLTMAAGASAFWLVRVGLRPLVHIADTADAVASGDVERRVDIRGGYEVARLGNALNSAFDARATSEQTLREFISDASHELRTPLTSIRGYAELLRAGALPCGGRKRRAVARIEQEAARMGVLVDNLLVVGPPRRRPTPGARRRRRDRTGRRRRQRRARVEPDRPITLVAPRPVPVVGDETTLRQVLANLLANARVHTPAARRSRSGSRRHRPGSGSTWSTTVPDSTTRRASASSIDSGGGPAHTTAARRQRPRARDRHRGRGCSRGHRAHRLHRRPAPGRALRRRRFPRGRRPDRFQFTSGAQLSSKQLPGSAGLLGRCTYDSFGTPFSRVRRPSCSPHAAVGRHRAAGSGSTTTTVKGSTSRTALSDCLKQHGVTLPAGLGNGGPPAGGTPGCPRAASVRAPGAAALRGRCPPASTNRSSCKRIQGVCGERQRLQRPGGGQNSQAFQAYTSCLGDHGVKVHPPAKGSTPATFDRTSAAFTAANKTCAALLLRAGPPPPRPLFPPTDSESPMRKQLLIGSLVVVVAAIGVPVRDIGSDRRTSPRRRRPS